MISLRSALLSALLFVASCAAPMAEGGAEGSPALATDETTAATPEAGNAAELVRCQSACRQGVEAMESYCRSCPEPRAKLFCWGAARAGLVACLGFCYNWWGS
jgi:hypothetical protein